MASMEADERGPPTHDSGQNRGRWYCLHDLAVPAPGPSSPRVWVLLPTGFSARPAPSPLLVPGAWALVSPASLPPLPVPVLCYCVTKCETILAFYGAISNRVNTALGCL